MACLSDKLIGENNLHKLCKVWWALFSIHKYIDLECSSLMIPTPWWVGFRRHYLGPFVLCALSYSLFSHHAPFFSLTHFQAVSTYSSQRYKIFVANSSDCSMNIKKMVEENKPLLPCTYRTIFLYSFNQLLFVMTW